MQDFNKIKSARVGAGITQEQMAECLKISRQNYIAKENGNIEFKLKEANKFVKKVNKETGNNYKIEDIFF